jgi:hypothetical protein
VKRSSRTMIEFSIGRWRRTRQRSFMPREYTLVGEEGTRVPKIAVVNASEGAGGRQDKGSCSHQLLSLCLHIDFSRDARTPRETENLCQIEPRRVTQRGLDCAWQSRAQACWLRL